jgi:hypothetical protein
VFIWCHDHYGRAIISGMHSRYANEWPVGRPRPIDFSDFTASILGNIIYISC